jgi:hypothetical protein
MENDFMQIDWVKAYPCTSFAIKELEGLLV